MEWLKYGDLKTCTSSHSHSLAIGASSFCCACCVVPIPNGRHMQIAIRTGVASHVKPQSALGVTYTVAEPHGSSCSLCLLSCGMLTRRVLIGPLCSAYPSSLPHSSRELLDDNEHEHEHERAPGNAAGQIAPGSMPPALAFQAKVYWYEHPYLPLPHISPRPHRRRFGHLSYVAGRRGTTRRLSLARFSLGCPLRSCPGRHRAYRRMRDYSTACPRR